MKILGALIMLVAVLLAYACPAFHDGDRATLDAWDWGLMVMGLVLVLGIFLTGMWMVLA